MSARTFEGTVASNKMTKTLVVTVDRQFPENRTGKIVHRQKRYKVHTEVSDIGIGDQILFSECRPISRDKKYRLLKVLKKVQAPSELKEGVV